MCSEESIIPALPVPVLCLNISNTKVIKFLKGELSLEGGTNHGLCAFPVKPHDIKYMTTQPYVFVKTFKYVMIDIQYFQ